MFWILIALVVLAPLPFGAVHSWAWGLAGVTVGVLLLGWCAERLVRREPPAVAASRVWPVLMFFAIAVGWAILQMAPFMPDGWTHPLWAEAAAALGDDSSADYISIEPHATGSALVRLLTYGGVFWLALQYGRDRKRASTMLYALALSGMAFAAYGLIVEFSGARSILWFTKTSDIDSVTSTFVSRNSYATYAGLGLVVTTGLIMEFVRKSYGNVPGIRREKLRQFLIGLTTRGWILMLAWAVLVTALLLTDSRGGFLSACIGLISLFMASAVSRRMRTRHAMLLAIGVFSAGVAFFVLSDDTVTGRLAGSGFENENRMATYELSMTAVSDSPWGGAGYGTFKDVFRIYRDETIPGIYDEARNIFLENALELGVPASLSLSLAVIYAVAYCAVGIRRRQRDKIYPTIAFSAAVLVGSHSMVDFSLQTPAVGATFSLILGIGCAQSWSSRARVSY